MTEETMKKANNHGGAREGAGRKKLTRRRQTIPFFLIEYKKAAVKDYIVSMRREAAGKPKISINMEETLFKLAFQMLKPSAAKDVTAKVSSFLPNIINLILHIITTLFQVVITLATGTALLYPVLNIRLFLF